MTKHLNPICRQQVNEALKVYREEVGDTPLARSTKDTYLLHMRNFIRWMHGDFEPGRRNRLGSFLIASVVAISAFAPIISSFAGSEEDAARIERKFEIRELARQILERVDKRTEEAAKNSPTIQENNKVMLLEINVCLEQSDQRLKVIREGNLSAETSQGLLLECIEVATDKNPNDEILDELREEFINEEIEALRDSLEEPKRKELEKEIRELSA